MATLLSDPSSVLDFEPEVRVRGPNPRAFSANQACPLTLDSPQLALAACSGLCSRTMTNGVSTTYGVDKHLVCSRVVVLSTPLLNRTLRIVVVKLAEEPGGAAVLRL